MSGSQIRPRARQPEADSGTRTPETTAPSTASAVHEIRGDPGLARLAANRVVIENVSPEIDGGRFPAKAAVGDRFAVEADIFCRRARQDRRGAAHPPRRRRGLAAKRRWRSSTTTAGAASPWSRRTRRYVYTMIAWRDLFATWRDEVGEEARRRPVDIGLELIEGRNLVEAALGEGDRASAADREALTALLAEPRRRRPTRARLARLIVAGDARR